MNANLDIRPQRTAAIDKESGLGYISMQDSCPALRMRSFAILLLIVFVAFSGCGELLTLVVTLETPADGSAVPSLTPILAWSCTGVPTAYRLQVAADSDFQNLIIDITDLEDASYDVPPGKLAYGQTYYWRVNASAYGQTSGWSTYWSFETPTGTGTLLVDMTIDGSSWPGEVSYTISGPKTDCGSSVPQTFSDLPAGTYTVFYNSGGPDGPTLVSITPSPTQTLHPDGLVSFTLNFMQPAGIIAVNTTLDGSPWAGEVNYTVCGPKTDSSSAAPQVLSDLPAGTYTVTYNSGGPDGATLVNIKPSPTQTLDPDDTITFTLEFMQPAGAIAVKALVDGLPWSGRVHYTVDGPKTDCRSSVPQTFTNFPAGTYTVTYNSGGPATTTLVNVTPSPTQTLAPDGTITFTLNFMQPAGSATVDATVDGSPWAGEVNYTITGPKTDFSSSVPQSFNNLPAGTYTVTYSSGGPDLSVLDAIHPSPTRTLSYGDNIKFTLNFVSILRE